MPLEVYSKTIFQAGFTDTTSRELFEHVTLVGFYKGVPTKSLQLKILEFICKQKAVIHTDCIELNSVRINFIKGTYDIPIQLKAENDLTKISASDFLSSTSSHRVKNKIVILTLNNGTLHCFNTTIGPVDAHTFFTKTLVSMCHLFKI